ncbi:MAG: hypothetical protein WC475_03100, partial [Candidatus Paceibacterota bacterium]
FLAISLVICGHIHFNCRCNKIIKIFSAFLGVFCIFLLFYFLIGYFSGINLKESVGNPEKIKLISQRWGDFITSFSIIIASLLVGLIQLFNVNDAEISLDIKKNIAMLIFALIFLMCAFISHWYGGMVLYEKLI